MAIDVAQIRTEFPILETKIGKYPLVYFDNGATTQKPVVVIDAIRDYYLHSNSNIHRGVHHLSQKATTEYEEVRKKVAEFCSCSEKEVVFTYGTTDSINLVAQVHRKLLEPGDGIIITEQDHHSNLVPWHMLAEETGATIHVVHLLADGSLNMDEFIGLLDKNIKIAAFNHVSNSLGTINPVKEMVAMCSKKGITTVVDGAQAIAHIPLNFHSLNADFYSFSGHKMYGPTGVGVLLGKEALLNQLPPYRGGGEMIGEVKNSGYTVNSLPHKFEAGTPGIAEVIGMGAAFDFLNHHGLENIAAWENELLKYGTQQLLNIPDITIIGTAQNKSAIISFVHKSLHGYDLGAIMDKLGIAVRTGHHCCQPVMEKYGISGTVRASFAVYNTKEEIDTFIAGLQQAISMLS